MFRHFTLLAALCSTVACTQSSAADWSAASNQTALASRAFKDVSYFDTKEGRERNVLLDFHAYCPKGQRDFVDKWVKPGPFPSPDQVGFRQCYDRQIEVHEWRFGVDAACAPDAQYHYTAEVDTSNGSFDVEAKDRDVFKWIDVKVCVTKPRDCWGEWINKPVWDYEWIVRIPYEVSSKDPTGVCGATYLEAINEACDPFQTTAFTCNQFWYGTELRFRHNLLCGRTRIQNAIKKASNNEVEVQCPYFVEVPVPP